MAENKTKKTDASVDDFLNSIEDDRRRNDAVAVAALMGRVSGEPPRMWGSSIVGYGDVHMTYDSGREVDYMKVGFSPRKAALTLYITPGLDRRAELLANLGDHSTGKGCLYIKDLRKVDQSVLEELIRVSVEEAEELDTA